MKHDEKVKIIVWEKSIKMPIRCQNNDCKKWNKDAVIKDINYTCPFCKQAQQLDISTEYPDEYNQEALRSPVFIAFKELRDNDEIIIQYHPKNKKQVDKIREWFKKRLVFCFGFLRDSCCKNAQFDKHK